MRNLLIFRHFFAFIFSYTASYYLIPYLIRIAHYMHLLDVPDGKIKIHQNPIPHLGGIAIFIGFITTLGLTYTFQNITFWLILGCTLLLFVGLIDDMCVLYPWQKLMGQMVAVSCFLKGGFALKTTFLSSWFNLFLSAFWMLSIINAFNLVDIMDGLAVTIALTVAGTFLVIAFCLKHYMISLLLMAFIGSLIAFFLYNKPPAKVYLGDAGAMFIGGFLAAIPMLYSWSSQSFDAYYAPVMILAIPLLEVAGLVVIRMYYEIPFWHGSPHHFAIYLQQRGWQKKSILFLVAGMGGFLSVAAILFLFNYYSFMTFFLLGVGFIIFWIALIFRTVSKEKTTDNINNCSSEPTAVGSMSCKNH